MGGAQLERPTRVLPAGGSPDRVAGGFSRPRKFRLCPPHQPRVIFKVSKMCYTRAMGTVTALACKPKFERPVDLPFRCSDEELVEAVQAWLMGAKEEVVAGILRVPVRSLRGWGGGESWQYLMGCLSDPVRKLVHGQMTRLTNKALARIEERLDKGEPYYDEETGEVKFYREIRTKDLAALTATLVDKQIDIEKRLLGEKDIPQIPLEIAQLWAGLKRYSESHPIEGDVIGKVVGGAAG
jgi:hypothetical protein